MAGKRWQASGLHVEMKEGGARLMQCRADNRAERANPSGRGKRVKIPSHEPQRRPFAQTTTTPERHLKRIWREYMCLLSVFCSATNISVFILAIKHHKL